MNNSITIETKEVHLIRFHDPGHSWLQVPQQLLIESGVLDAISPYSYYRQGYAYLEEDCDLWTFYRAAEAKGWKVEWKDNTTNNDSRIRHYSSFPSFGHWQERMDEINAAYAS
jgi:hypothetical protein